MGQVEDEKDPEAKRAWLTTHATANGRRPAVASMTLNNMEVGIRALPKYDGIGIQVHVSPMSMEEWGLIRAALNSYWKEHNLEDK